MAIVAGVDFGTLSVRVSIVDSERGLLATALAEYPLHRKREDPEYATQSHDDQMRALAAATREAVHKANISSDRVEALAIDTTGSSVIPVGENLEPLDEYYLWCDHRAGRSRGDHRCGDREASCGDSMVRRSVLLGVGFLEAAALAAAQSGEAIAIRYSVRALRHGGGDAWRFRIRESNPLGLRNGT